MRDHHIDFEITDHAPLFSMEDKPNVRLPYPEWDAKNLFIRDHKREHYYLIIVFRLVRDVVANHKTTRYAGAATKVIQKNHLA